MENKKLGGGILAISILYLVFLSFGLMGNIISFSTLDQINAVSSQMGIPQLTSTELIISIILSLVLVIGSNFNFVKKENWSLCVLYSNNNKCYLFFNNEWFKRICFNFNINRINITRSTCILYI